MLFLTLLLSFVNISLADDRQKIVVIDSGWNETRTIEPYMCKDGHVDFTGRGLEDIQGHGTYIVNIIAGGMDVDKQCIIMLKWWHDEDTWNRLTGNKVKKFDAFLNKILKKGAEYNPKLVNMSYVGEGYGEGERTAIEHLLNMGATVVVASGNDGLNLNEKCDAYPACYKFPNSSYYVVANYKDGRLHNDTNFGGTVNVAELGEYRIDARQKITGTSVSAAIFSRNYLKLGKSYVIENQTRNRITR